MSIGTFLIFTGSHLINPTRVALKKGRKELERELSQDDPSLAFKQQQRLTADLVDFCLWDFHDKSAYEFHVIFHSCFYLNSKAMKATSRLDIGSAWRTPSFAWSSLFA
jgi:hypothetical protein